MVCLIVCLGKSCGSNLIVPNDKLYGLGCLLSPVVSLWVSDRLKEHLFCECFFIMCSTFDGPCGADSFRVDSLIILLFF